MWEKIFNLALSNGLWAVLFLALLVHQLRDSRLRERKYQNTIDALGKSLETINDVKSDVEDIKMALIRKAKRKGDNNENSSKN